jgi:HNH endonuclease
MLTPIERFYRMLDRSSEHWLWKGKKFKNTGYGYVVRHVNGRRKALKAHRVSWELHFGPIPTGMNVLHHCDIPVCANPSCLFLGTHGDNARDRNTKGRQVQGERVHTARVTPTQVVEIRTTYALGGVRQVDLGKQYGLSQSATSALLRGASWKSA